MKNERYVLCSKYKEEKLGLNQNPFPGPLGRKLYDCVSQEAWDEWIELQTKLINEYQLDLSDLTQRNLLYDEMLSFLNLKEYD